jgi:Flp pilus assembly protein TadD
MGFALAVWLGVAGTGAAAACKGPASMEARIHDHPDAGAYAELGAWFDRNHQAECAVQAYRAALKIDPGSKAALNALARSLIAAGDYASVISSLQGAARDENLTLDLAIAYRKTGRLNEEEQTLQQGLKADPRSDALTAALVSLYVDESHYEAATTLSEEIATAKPQDLEAQRIYLRTLVITGDNDRAVPLGRRLLSLAPHDADLLNLNGLLEKRAGDYQAARRHLEEAVALSPGDYNSRVNLGVVLADLNDPAGAKVQLEKARALGADAPQIYFELARVLRALGQTEAAQRELGLYQQKLKQESDRVLAVSNAAEAAEAEKAGDNQKAAGLLRQACAAEPRDAGLAWQLALVLDNLGDQAGERAALEGAIQANPHFALAHYRLGYMDFQGGDNAGAEREFRLTVEDLPDNVQAWISLAATLQAESRSSEAREAVGRALQLDPDNATALSLSRKLATGRHEH